MKKKIITICITAIFLITGFNIYVNTSYDHTKANAELVHVTKITELNKQFTSKKLVLVDFYADWCPPCRQLAPSLEKLQEKHHKKVKVVKVNIDKAKELSQKYNVSSIPALFLFKKGKIVDQVIGNVGYNALVKMIHTENKL